MKHLEFSPDSHPNKYTRQRVWTSGNWFYSWVFSCLVTYLWVFREVDDIGCRHFRKKHVAGDSSLARTPSTRPWTVWQLGYETKKKVISKGTSLLHFLHKSYMRINLPERSQIWLTHCFVSVYCDWCYKRYCGIEREVTSCCHGSTIFGSKQSGA